MSEFSFMTKALKMDKALIELVKELQRELPSDATDVTLLICSSSFVKPEIGKIGDNIPMRFVLPASPDDIVGYARLGFNRGALESSTRAGIGGLGCILDE